MIAGYDLLIEPAFPVGGAAGTPAATSNRGPSTEDSAAGARFG
jgi:hypothetical protein